jgi:type IV secretory pathway VirB2 component (pilin)
MATLNKKLFLIILLLVNMFPIFSFAQVGSNDSLVRADKNNNKLAYALCKGVQITTSTPFKVIAAIFVMATGAGFLLGKVQIQTIIGVALGVATIFGAPKIYNVIKGGNVDDSCEKIV